MVKRWSIAPCEDPSGLAFDGKYERLFSVCGNRLMAVSDAHAGKLVTEDAPDRYHVVETVPTMTGARTMTLAPATHRVYTASARFGSAPAAATADNPSRRPPMVPGSFTLLVLQR